MRRPNRRWTRNPMPRTKLVSSGYALGSGTHQKNLRATGQGGCQKVSGQPIR